MRGFCTRGFCTRATGDSGSPSTRRAMACELRRAVKYRRPRVAMQRNVTSATSQPTKPTRVVSARMKRKFDAAPSSETSVALAESTHAPMGYWGVLSVVDQPTMPMSLVPTTRALGASAAPRERPSERHAAQAWVRMAVCSQGMWLEWRWPWFEGRWRTAVGVEKQLLHVEDRGGQRGGAAVSDGLPR